MNHQSPENIFSIRDRLRTDLRTALKARNLNTVSVLRVLLAAIDNAEAVDIAAAPHAINGAAPDVARRILSDSDLQAIVVAEAQTYHATLATYETHGQLAAAAQIRQELAVIVSYLPSVVSEE